MTKIKNIALKFSCTEKLEQKHGGRLFCSKCTHHVIDFTSKSSEELQDEINKSTRSVCGVFKRSQLSDQFLKYAAATVIATSSLTIPAMGQEPEKTETSTNSLTKLEAEEMLVG